MYIKPYVLAEEDINRMLKRRGGIFEYNIDSSIIMITIRGVKYGKDTEPEIIFDYKTAFNSDFSGETSRFIFQVSKDYNYISLLTNCATGGKIYNEFKSHNLGYIFLNKKIDIIPDVAIPFLIMPNTSVLNPYWDIESYINRPEIVEEYPPIFIFTITFHSHLPLEQK